MKNIIFLTHAEKNPSGGAKVIYNHSLTLNFISKNVSSKIVHLKKNFLYKLEQSYQRELNFLKKNILAGMEKK